MDPAAIPLLGEKALRKYAALPLKVENGRLVLAVSDPTNVLALDDLKTLSGHPIRPVVALEEDIKKLQDRVFGIDEEVSELIGASGDGSRLECSCGERLTLTASRTTCGGCGADHEVAASEGLEGERLGNKAAHPWTYTGDRGDAGLSY